MFLNMCLPLKYYALLLMILVLKLISSMLIILFLLIFLILFFNFLICDVIFDFFPYFLVKVIIFLVIFKSLIILNKVVLEIEILSFLNINEINFLYKKLGFFKI